MQSDSVSTKEQTIDLAKGTYVIRYAAADDHISHPSVHLEIDKDDVDAISYILQRDEKAVILWQPGAGVAVRATRPGKLAIAIVPSHAGGSAAATIKIETLTLGENTFSAVETETTCATPTGDVGELRVLGHLAGRGDVFVSADAWLGGPAAPARIEGIALDWPQAPRGLNIGYSARFGRPLATASPPATLGSYVGTRGRALPLVGLSFELSGPDALRYQFAIEANFLGSPVAQMVGAKINLSGPTGREPLVGLRLRIETRTIVQPANPQRTALQSQSSGRVRVFYNRNKAVSA